MERDLWVKRQALQLRPGARVLDVGAGSCPYRQYFSHCEYRSQDLEVLQDHQLRDRHGYGGIDYRSDAAEIPVPDNSFDAILCTEVLEHVPEPIKVVREMSRILRPGGTLILTAPLGSGIHQAPYHFYGGYTPFWYARVLGENGMTVAALEANGGFFKHYGQESLRFVQMTIPWKLENAGALTRLAWTPIWLLLFPWLALVMPFLCHFLDRFDRKQEFTVGYHVLARKNGA